MTRPLPAHIPEEIPPPRSSPAWIGSSAGLAIAGGLCLAVWFIGLVVPASLIEHHESIPRNVPFRQVLGDNQNSFLWFVGVLAILSATYVIGVWTAGRATGRASRNVAIIMSVLLVVAALLVYPGLSRDIWHNISDGRLLWLYGFNPLTNPPSVVGDTDPLMSLVTAFENEPSYYAPLWYILTVVPAVISGNGVVANLFGFKLLTAIFFLLGIPLVYRIAERVEPGSGVLALVMYGWNPLLLFSSAVDGHNDIIMAFFMLASLHEAAYSRWKTAIPLILLGALVKYIAILLLPVLIALAVKRHGRQVIRELIVGTVAGTILAVLIWAPFWDGPGTLDGLRGGSDRAIHSLLSVLLMVTDPSRASFSGVPPVWRAVFTAMFLIICAAIFLQYWRKADSTFSAAVLTGTALLIVYLIVQAWWFFPWYLAWLMPIGAVLARHRMAVLCLIYTVSAMFIFAIFGWAPIVLRPSLLEYSIISILISLAPPFVYLAAWAGSQDTGHKMGAPSAT